MGTSNSEKIKAGDSVRIENASGYSEVCKGVSCEREIIAGSHALSEKGFMDGMPVGAYTCLTCIENWLEDSDQVDE